MWMREEDCLLYCLNDTLSFDGKITPPWIICTLKGIFIMGRGRRGNKAPFCVIRTVLISCACVHVCVLLTSSVCSISTGEYGGGPSMPHGASCKMSGVGRQIWRDTMKWTPSSLACGTSRDDTKFRRELQKMLKQHTLFQERLIKLIVALSSMHKHESAISLFIWL